ncbi:MAG: zinc metallopeptidase [Calditrichia bacterium]
MLFWGDWTFILLIPALIMAMYYQYKVTSTFKKYHQVANSRGMTGAQMAETLLKMHGIQDVVVEPTSGMLSDHYDPSSKRVRLSEDNYNGRSISAVTVAAHEVGHAIQHNTGYAPVTLRGAIFPIANLGTTLAFPLFFIGLIFQSGMSVMFMNLGILLFAGAVLFHLVTLPVEFDASRRALRVLNDNQLLLPDEMPYAKKVLHAAAMTYVAATLMAVLNLLRLLLIRSQYDD